MNIIKKLREWISRLPTQYAKGAYYEKIYGAVDSDIKTTSDGYGKMYIEMNEDGTFRVVPPPQNTKVDSLHKRV